MIILLTSTLVLSKIIGDFLFIEEILKLFIDIFFNFLNFLFFIFDLIAILIIEFAIFNFKNFFFFNFGAGFGLFLMVRSTILLAYIKFLNLFTDFFTFLFLDTEVDDFFMIDNCTTLFEIAIFINLFLLGINLLLVFSLLIFLELLFLLILVLLFIVKFLF